MNVTNKKWWTKSTPSMSSALTFTDLGYSFWDHVPNKYMYYITAQPHTLGSYMLVTISPSWINLLLGRNLLRNVQGVPDKKTCGDVPHYYYVKQRNWIYNILVYTYIGFYNTFGHLFTWQETINLWSVDKGHLGTNCWIHNDHYPHMHW